MSRTMKALISRLLAVLLCLGMVLPAGATIWQGDEIVETVTPVVVRTAKAYESGKKTATTLCLSHDESEIVVPIAITESGRLELELSYKPGAQAFIYLESDLYADAACTEKIGYSMDLVYGNLSVSRGYAVTGGSTVYFKMIQHRKSGIVGPARYQLKAALYSAANRSLKEGTSYIAAVEDGDQVGVYKIVTAKSGLLTFTVQGAEGKQISIYTTLCDSKKKAISEESYTVGEGAASKVYAVAKGTYYIRLRVASANSEVVRLSYSSEACKDESGASASKAADLSSGEAKCGYLGGSSKKGNADWYKVKVTKAGVLTVDVTAIGDGSVMLMVTDKKGKEAWYGSKRIQAGDNSFSTAKLAKGVYYIKVYKDSAKAGLSYEITVK